MYRPCRPFYDGQIGPKTRMLIAVDAGDIPDELSPYEIQALVDLVLEDRLGRGRARKFALGKWYDIVQSLVNQVVERKRIFG